MWKRVEAMNGEEVVSEAHTLAQYAEDCRQIGQGINSKEVVRFRRCMERIETEKLCPPAEMVDLHAQWDERFNGSTARSMLLKMFEGGVTMSQLREAFAPPKGG